MTFPFHYQEEMRSLLGEEEYQKYECCVHETPYYGLRLNPGKVPADRREQVLGVCKAEKAGPGASAIITAGRLPRQSIRIILQDFIICRSPARWRRERSCR